MNVLLKQAQLIYPGHKLHLKTLDILVQNGKIKKINPKHKELPSNYKEINSNELKVSPGWLDLRSTFGEPGYEERETLESGSKAAASGGYTAVCISPNNTPVSDNRSALEFIRQHSEKWGVELLPLGAITKQTLGNDLAEMQDMQIGGAVAFSDGLKSIENSRVMQLAMDYSSGLNAVIMSYCMETDLQGKAQVNESENTLKLGLKGISHLAEELRVNRDLYLADYTQSRLHIMGLSSEHSVDLVSKAKKKNQNITCDVDVMHLVESDNALHEFESNFKVTPPLRNEADRRRLVKGVLDNSIDIITTNHTPQNPENKVCEFEIAAYGSSTIQTAYSLVNTELKGKISSEIWVEKVAINPRKLLDKEPIEFDEGVPANLTVFDPSISWKFSKDLNTSKSPNSPYFEKVFTGKVIGTIAFGNVHLNNY
jgi:dihydroorotase